MSITAASDAIDLSPSSTSLSGLDGINFFLAGMLAGFGPFVAVLLADEKWTEQNIGYVLSVSGIAGLLSQLPGGELLDSSRSKRFLLALGAVVAAVSALVMALWPILPVVFAALVLQGLTGGVLGPAVAAISLGLVGHAALAERLGRNQRFASTGALIATGLMGAISYFLSYRAIFFVSAALVLPLLLAIARVRPADIHFGRSCGQPDHHTSAPPPRAERLSLSKNFNLLIFAGCLFLFQFANASMLPLVGERLAYRNRTGASFVISALIILPQIVVAISAPSVGQLAQSWGRRPLLLIGFGALAVRALLFAVTVDPPLLICIQLLDGVSGSVLGVLTALIIADLTNGTGRFNLAQGFVGMLAGVGAVLSTTFFGLIVGNFGSAIGFLSIAAAALITVFLAWLLMPETGLPETKRLNEKSEPLRSA
ncbi:MAG TPA: MFS transporter [Pseudolabrys sp.]|nr:MFS transporter [Pseudolabrys sp.]